MIKKVKIRDLTEEQIKHACTKKSCDDCQFSSCFGCLDYFMQREKTNCLNSLSDEILNREVEVEVEVPDILTDEEREWLRGLSKCIDDKPTLIKISTRMHGPRQIVISFANDSFSAPVKEDYFKGMEEDKEYTLEELGL